MRPSFSGLILLCLFPALAVAGGDCSQSASDSRSTEEVASQIRRWADLPHAALCRQQKNFLDRAIRHSVSPARAIDAAAASRAPVVLIGESHAERSEHFYRWAIERLRKKNPALDCVLVEQPEDGYQKGLDRCNEKKKDCATQDLPEFSGVKEGLSLGLKVFAVDAQPDPRGIGFLPFGGSQAPEGAEPFSFVADVKKRNYHMAASTTRLLQSKTCHAAVLIVGMAHGLHDPRLPSVPELLGQRGISTYRISLGSPGNDVNGNPDGRWIWTDEEGKPLCPNPPAARTGNFAFVDQRAAADLPAFYDPFSDVKHESKEFMGRWSDYDASIFLACDDPETKRCVAAKPRPR